MTGLELKVRRVGARVKARELAEAMGVTPSRVSSIEREAVVTPVTRDRYLEALGTLTNVRTTEAAVG